MAETVALAIFAAAGTTAAEVGARVGLTAAAASTIVSSGALLLGGVGLNLAAGALQDGQKVQAQQFNAKQAVPPRSQSYGRQKIGGYFVQYRSQSGSFFYGLYHGEGPWAAIEEIWLDDIHVLTLPAGTILGIVNDVPWRGRVAIEGHLGSPAQPVSTMLLPTKGWSAAHYLNGCVYTAVQSKAPDEKKFKNYFPSQTWPKIRVVARTALVRNTADPAQTADPATWVWSDLAGPCIRDFLIRSTGMRVPVALINEPSFVAFSAMCGEAVTTRAGIQIPRYTLGGTYRLTDDPTDTLSQMLAACDAELTLEPDGTIGIRGGKAPVPTVTITDPTIISMQVEKRGSKYAAFNRLKITFCSPPHDYQQTEGQAWDDTAAQARDGELMEEDFSRPWVQQFNQVRRLAKIAMAKGNPEWKISLVTDLSAAAALFEQAIRFKLSLYGIDAVFLVTRAAADTANGTCSFELQSIDLACYDFNAAIEEGDPPLLPSSTSTAVTPDAPINPTVVIERRSINGNLNAAFLRLTASAPVGRSDLTLYGQYRLAGTAAWTDMERDGQDPYSLTSAVLQDGGVYEVQAAFASYGQALSSPYVNAQPYPIVAVADPNPPGAPGGLSADVSGGVVTLTWTDSGSPNVVAANVYRDGAYLKHISAGPDTSSTTTDVPGPGTHTYTVRDANASGAESGDSNTASATVS